MLDNQEVLVEEVQLDLTFQEEMGKQILEVVEPDGVMVHQQIIQADLADLEKF